MDTARFLTTGAGQTLLAQAETLRADGHDTLSALTRLRKDAGAEHAAAAWEQVTLRQRAVPKFGADAARMLFTREALEQASGRRAAAYHAARFAGAGHVSDLCGGIGADALAFARAGLSVTLYELDPVRAMCASHNADALGFSHLLRVVQADVTSADIAPGAAWLDPSRRAGGRRVGGVEEYAPPLSWVRGLAARGVSLLGVKVSPAVPHAVALKLDAALEFVSDARECKEGLLWVGVAPAPFEAPPAPNNGGARISLAPPLLGVGGLPGAKGTVTATLLTDTGPLHLTGTPDTLPLPVGDGAILYEPDPAVIRAHLVGTLAAQLNAACVDPQIAYLLAQEHTPTPFATAYAVRERFAWNRRRLQERLTACSAGRVVVKKRGFPLEPDDVRRGLKLSGMEEWVVVLSRAGSGHDVFLCRPLTSADRPGGEIKLGGR